MISLDFAPNETREDAQVALSLLLTPWKWRNGDGNAKVKRRLKSLFFHPTAQISLFLSGRGALYVLLQQLKLEPGCTILVQGFTCEAVVLPILALGHQVRYVDIGSQDYSMSVSDLQKKYTPLCKALILQHTFGICPENREAILQFAKKHDVVVIEDVAHGFKSSLFKRTHSSHLLLSFGRSKRFSSVFGGGIVTCDPKLAKQLSDSEKKLSPPTWMHLFKMVIYKPLAFLVKRTYSWQVGKAIHTGGKWCRLFIPEISSREKRGEFDVRMLRSYPNLLAYLLLSQLRTFNDVSNQRKTICLLYHKALGLPEKNSDSDYTRFPFQTTKRDELIRRCLKNHIFLGNWYQQPVAPIGVSLPVMHYTPQECPTAEDVCRTIVNLPTQIATHEANRIIDIIKHVST